jgi:hypothetical protein
MRTAAYTVCMTGVVDDTGLAFSVDNARWLREHSYRAPLVLGAALISAIFCFVGQREREGGPDL